MESSNSRWIRVGLALLAVPQLITGLWAVLAPENWFDKFPGADPRLVAGEPPYNAHLASDAGAGFLATGLILAIAIAWPQRNLILTALAGFLAFSLPHFLYHAFNPAPGLSASEDVTNAVTLAFGLVIAVVLVVVTVGRRRIGPAPAAAANASIP